MNKQQLLSSLKKHYKIILIIVMFLIGGTGQTIMPKTAYQTEYDARDGETAKFIKPLFFNWCMFVGMTLCLIIYIVQYCLYPYIKNWTNRQKHIEQLDGEETPNKPQRMPLKSYLLILVCSLCDFLATYLMNFSLIIVSSSIFQMMKGSIIVFTAILAIFYRKQKLFGFEWTSVGIIVVSLVVIGSATMCPGYQEGVQTVEESLSVSEEPNDLRFILLTIGGIVFILIGQFLQALETVIEEQSLHDINAPVTFVVGLEGIYGLIICSALMPIM